MPKTKANEPQKDVCFVEASRFDKDASYKSSRASDIVWNAVKPPTNLGESKPPLVSARRVEIVRAHLSGVGKVKGKDDSIAPFSPDNSDILSSTKISKF